nr:hypothetical protein Iba_chr08aCG11350 [Ipomoea batatas]GMD87840.1 hypothetical protein Iba_chr14cCG1260 [Ipomoea batatas]
MLVDLVVQIVQPFSQVQVVMTRTRLKIMPLMHSMTTTKKTQFLPAVSLEDQHSLLLLIQVLGTVTMHHRKLPPHPLHSHLQAPCLLQPPCRQAYKHR